jgi:RluA family pseudouridine synthase
MTEASADKFADKVAYFKHIGPHAEGQSLIHFLCARFTYFGSEHWTQLIENGDVLLNDAPTRPEYCLRAGDKVSYRALMRPEPAVPTQIAVVYEDEDLLVVNKPPHLPVHPTGRYLRNTLIHLLQKQRRTKNLFLSHRLDRETSGLCVLAKSNLAKEKLYWQFFNNEVDKTYWALVWGRPNPPSGLIDAPIGPAQGPGSKSFSQIRIKQVVGGSHAKSAQTKYHTLSTKMIHAPEWEPPRWSQMPEKGPWPISLVEAKPITGRTNQIRVHLAHIGSGVVGDKLYDPEESTFLAFKDQNRDLKTTKGSFVQLNPELQKRLVLDAHALHARRIGFRHPRSGEWLELEAAVPKSWLGLYTLPSKSNPTQSNPQRRAASKPKHSSSPKTSQKGFQNKVSSKRKKR